MKFLRNLALYLMINALYEIAQCLQSFCRFLYKVRKALFGLVLP